MSASYKATPESKQEIFLLASLDRNWLSTVPRRWKAVGSLQQGSSQVSPSVGCAVASVQGGEHAVWQARGCDVVAPYSSVTWPRGSTQARVPIWSCSESIEEAEQTENYFLAWLALQAWCPQFARCSVRCGQGSMGAWGGGEEGWPSHDGVTLHHPGISKLPPRWWTCGLICGRVHKHLLLAVLCQHSSLRGLMLNQITVTFSLPCCVIFQADQSSTGAHSMAVGTSVPTQPCGWHMGGSGGK